MKRIVDGRTYNTDTATAIAETKFRAPPAQSYAREWVDCTITIYETRGEYFQVRHEEWEVERNDQWVADKEKYYLEPLTAEAARKALSEGDWEQFADIPKKAGAEDDATIIVRVPASLKRRVEAKAKALGQSINVFTLRCYENCVKPVPAPATKAKKPRKAA